MWSSRPLPHRRAHSNLKKPLLHLRREAAQRQDCSHAFTLCDTYGAKAFSRCGIFNLRREGHTNAWISRVLQTKARAIMD